MKDGSELDRRIESAGCPEVVSFLCVPLLSTHVDEETGRPKSKRHGVVFAANKRVVGGVHQGSTLRFSRSDEEHATLIAENLCQVLEKCIDHDVDNAMKVRRLAAQVETQTCKLTMP